MIPELPEINSGFASCYPKFPNKIRVSGISGSGSGIPGSGFGLRVFCPALIVRGVVLASPERWKATLVESRFEGSLTNPAQEIKWRLDRGAVGSFESTSTWTRGDRQVIDTTGKNSLCHVSSSSRWFATFLTSLYLLVHILMLVSICCSYMLLYI